MIQEEHIQKRMQKKYSSLTDNEKKIITPGSGKFEPKWYESHTMYNLPECERDTGKAGFKKIDTGIQKVQIPKIGEKNKSFLYIGKKSNE